MDLDDLLEEFKDEKKALAAKKSTEEDPRLWTEFLATYGGILSSARGLFPSVLAPHFCCLIKEGLTCISALIESPLLPPIEIKLAYDFNLKISVGRLIGGINNQHTKIIRPCLVRSLPTNRVDHGYGVPFR